MSHTEVGMDDDWRRALAPLLCYASLPAYAQLLRHDDIDVSFSLFAVRYDIASRMPPSHACRHFVTLIRYVRFAAPLLIFSFIAPSSRRYAAVTERYRCRR